MTDDDKLATAVHRGGHAEQLLSDELLLEAFASLDRQYITAWRRTPVRDTLAREKLWQAVNIVGLVQDHLRAIVAGGTLAKADIELRQTMKGSQ